ncbi:MAG: protein kinase [Gemmatimonadaceae bacterium]|nr:protein kinase [Gemmatimonadaceae bacterium]
MSELFTNPVSVMVSASDLQSGSTFGGYRIERLLGRGGMGAVFAAERLEDGRQVAVKVLAASLDRDADRQRFIREGKIAASINHPNTVYVYRTEEIDGLPTIIMELVDGGTLEQKVQRLGPLSLTEAINDIVQVIDGLDAAEQLGILHRDIKPANCFVGPMGEVKVGDFGLSRPVDQVDDVRLTQSGLFLGTPVFSSPEQLMGESLDLRADIYAVGATLYYLLSGALPYDADNAARLIALVMNGTPTPLASRGADLPAALDAVVMKCLARKRDERFANYASLRSALVACLPERAVPAALGRRFGAAMIDGLSTEAVVYLIYAAIGAWTGTSVDHALPEWSLRRSAVDFLAYVPLALAFQALPMGRWGWTIGSLVAGIRVQRDDGGHPGVARAAVRILLIACLGVLDVVSAALAPNEDIQFLLSSALSLSAVALLFARAREANGYRAEHDRLTGTRVVRYRTAIAPVHAQLQRPTLVPATSTGRRGPYALGDFLAGSRDVRIGVDEALGRTVWVVERTPGDAPLSRTAQNTVRSGSLRWVGGRRTHEEAWDAYASVAGDSLRARLQRSAAWAEVHQWLTDLSEELRLREADEHQQSVSLDHVWISDDQHAIVLPFAVGDDTSAERRVKTLLPRVAQAILAADRDAMQSDRWPLHAHAMLRALASNRGDLPEMQRILRAVPRRRHGMTRERRILLWGATAIPTVLLVAAVATRSSNRQRADEAQLRMAPLLEFVQGETDTTVSTRDSRDQVAHYIAAHFRAVIVSRGGADSTSRGALSRTDWHTADSIVAAYPTVTDEQRHRAEILVDSTWRGMPPGFADPMIAGPAISSFTMLLFVFALAAAASLLWRRGLPMRLLGLDIANSRGEPAGRIRVFARQLMAWLPALALGLATTAIVSWGPRPKSVALVGVSCAVAVYGILSTYRRPHRGLAEYLTGTQVVPS